MHRLTLRTRDALSPLPTTCTMPKQEFVDDPASGWRLTRVTGTACGGRLTAPHFIVIRRHTHSQRMMRLARCLDCGHEYSVTFDEPYESPIGRRALR